MIHIKEGEKVIAAKFCNHLDGLSQKQGKLYLTSSQVIFEDKKNTSNNIAIALSEISSCQEVKVFNILTFGFQLHLDNGIQHCFSLFRSKDFLAQIENVLGESIRKSPDVKHHWLANIVLGLVVGWFVIIPAVKGVAQAVNTIRYNLDPVAFIENSRHTIDDVRYRFDLDSDQLSYPNLHGEWAFYDSHSDKSWSLNIELEKSNRGKYVLWYKWDGDESWKREEKGDFEVGFSKDQYGDSRLLGYNRKDLKFKSDSNDRNYLFSAVPMGSGLGLRLGPSFGVWNSMFGVRMRKVSNTPTME